VSPGGDASAGGTEKRKLAALKQFVFLDAPPACASFSRRVSNCAQPLPARPSNPEARKHPGIKHGNRHLQLP